MRISAQSSGLLLNMCDPVRDRRQSETPPGQGRREATGELACPAVSLRWYEPGQVRRVCSQATRHRAATPNDAPVGTGGKEDAPNRAGMQAASPARVARGGIQWVAPAPWMMDWSSSGVTTPVLPSGR